MLDSHVLMVEASTHWWPFLLLGEALDSNKDPPNKNADLSPYELLALRGASDPSMKHSWNMEHELQNATPHSAHPVLLAKMANTW